MKAPRQVRVRSHLIEISALDYGGEHLPPMLILHGMRDLAWSFDELAQHFRSRFRVVVMDHRGHGDSDHVGYYALPHFAIDVRKVIQGLALDRPVIVGHSFGGEVASYFAGLFPETPRALILAEGIGPPLWEEEGSREAGFYWARMSIESLDRADPSGRRVKDLDAAAERIRANHARLGAEQARFLAEVGTRPHPEGGLTWKWDPFLRTSWGSFNFQMIETAWSQVRCPVFVVNGTDSGQFWRRSSEGFERGRDERYLPPEELERRLSIFKDVECEEIEGAGHMIHFDEPARLSTAIDGFLDRRRIV